MWYNWAPKRKDSPLRIFSLKLSNWKKTFYRSQQRKREKHGLEDYEVDSYNNLKKILSNKWELVTMQAEEQLKVAKDRKKAKI